MTWEWSKFDDRGLARFVSAEVANRLRLAENRLDLMRHADGRYRLVAAIYHALLNLDSKIRYSPGQYHPSDAVQLIRTPSEILEMPGEGTCLDLALLFCGLCLGNELLPLIIILNGHALAAVSLNHGLTEWDAITRQCLTGDEPLTNVEQLRELIDSDQYLAIECTGFAESWSLPESFPEGRGRVQGFLSFNQAVSVGREQLDRVGVFRFAMDIATAHYKWHFPPVIQTSNLDRQVAYGLRIVNDENSTPNPGEGEAGQLSRSSTTGQPSDMSRGLELMLGVFNSKLERLSSVLSQEKAKQLDEFRELYQEGHFERARNCLNALRHDTDWDVFDKPLQAQVLQAMAGYTLNIEQNAEKAKSLATQACEIDPKVDNTVLRTLIIYHSEGAAIALKQMAPPSNIDSFNLQIGLLLELRQPEEVIAKLHTLPDELEPNAETDRIHALALLDKGDITGAQIKIQQACYKKPAWEKIQASAAIIKYNSVLSPALLKYSLDLPQPIDWSFVKQDDESLQGLRSAAITLQQLASHTERGEKQRHYWQEWYLACLANDPECQSEAEELCRILLVEDATNPCAIAWVTVRNYSIDLAANQQVLETLVASSEQDLEQITTLTEMYLSSDVPEQALDLLNRTRQKFNEAGHSELWLFWYVQVLIQKGDLEVALEAAEAFQNEITRRSIQTGILREQARVSHDWGKFAEYLETSWQESQHNPYFYETCQLRASLGEWEYVADRATDLVDKMRTPAALRLATQCSWQAKRYAQCLQLLTDHQQFFPSSILPPYLRQVGVYCQAKLGLISQAIAEAEELVRLHQTIETLTTLMDLQLNQGDLRGLTHTASRLLKQEEVQPVPLLRAARYILSEDRDLARQLWQRAVTVEITPDVLGEVIGLGYNLGLDRAVQPFTQQARILAITGNGPFQAVAVHELLKMQRQWTENAQEINQQYNRAQLPIHLIAQARKFSLASIFRALPKANAIDPNPHIQAAILARYGARPFPEDFADSSTQWRLHLDITALLLAAHLGVLDAVERCFSPIRISPMLPTALLQECEQFLEHQPSQWDAYREILRLHQAGKLHGLSSSLSSSSDELIEQLGEQSAVLLEQARTQNGFVVEFLPLKRIDADGQFHSILLNEADQNRMTNCRGLAESLWVSGFLSNSSYETALNNLGDERFAELAPRIPPKSNSIFINTELAKLLAGSDLLTTMCRHFRVFVAHQCIHEAQMAVNASQYSSEMLRWLRELIQRISTGIEQGRYEVIAVASSTPDHDAEFQRSWDANGLTVYDLFRYSSQPNDVIWIDDRFFSKYPNRDNSVPIIGVLEILEVLRVNNDLNEADYYDKILRLRASNIRFISITSKEILYHLKQAQLSDGRIQETEELVILRRYVASCLLDAHRLQRPPLPEGSPTPDGEMMFLLECFRETLDSIVAIWASVDIAEDVAEGYSDWILSNLYTGMFGIRHLLPNIDLSSDGLDLMSNDISQLYFRGVQLWKVEADYNHQSSTRRQQYFEWLESRVIERRFRANPELVSTVARLIKDIILYLGREQEEEESLQGIKRLMLKEFYRDLSECIQDELVTDPELNSYFQCQIVESINLTIDGSPTSLILPALDFLSAVSEAVNNGTGSVTALQPEVVFRVEVVYPTDTSIQLHFIDETNSTRYEWQDDLLLLVSNDPSVRERVLRSHRFWFDCDNATFEKTVDEIVVITDLYKRIDQVNAWRKQSAAVFYQSFGQKLRHEHSFSMDDLIPPSAIGLLRHFYLDRCAAENINSHECLVQAANSMLIAEDLETCLERFSCLPVRLPPQLREAFRNLSLGERVTLLERLLSRLPSPVCKLHLIDLALLSSSSSNLIEQTLDELCGEAGVLQFRLFKAILNLLANKFSYWHEVGEWVPAIRLALIWAHASKLHNLLYEPDVIVEEFVQILEEHQGMQAISADILNRDPSFWNDVLHPRRLHRREFIVRGLTTIVSEHDDSFLQAAGVHERLSTLAIETTEGQQFIHPALWHNVSALAQDNLCSLIGGDLSQRLSSIFGTELGQQISSESLKAVVESAINALISEPSLKAQWQHLFVFLGDLPIYSDFVEKLTNLVNNLDFVNLYHLNPRTAFLALMIASGHAANTADEELRTKLEEALVAIAVIINTQEQTEQVDDEIADDMLECILKLAVRAINPQATSQSLNNLLERISRIWFRFISRRAIGLSRAVQELPVNQLRGAWTTTLLIRALRDV